jgi:uncharacterized protein YkwD
MLDKSARAGLEPDKTAQKEGPSMRHAIVALCLVLVPACTMETPEATTPAAQAAPVPQAVAGVTDTTGLGPQINAFRADNGRAPLAVSADLTVAADLHARDMVENGYFSHTGLNGSTVARRVRASGCNWTGVAENIAQGQTSADQAMTTWINSAGHRANLLGPYTRYGAARAGSTWVLVFASGC